VTCLGIAAVGGWLLLDLTRNVLRVPKIPWAWSTPLSSDSIPKLGRWNIFCRPQGVETDGSLLDPWRYGK
jgi:hypothetical protein